MSGYQLDQCFNIYPRRFERMLVWDPKDVNAFYNINQDHEKPFIHWMCKLLNDPDMDNFLRHYKILVHFDRWQGLNTNLVCLF